MESSIGSSQERTIEVPKFIQDYVDQIEGICLAGLRGEWDEDKIQQLIHLLRSLTSSSAALGFTRINAIAGAFEDNFSDVFRDVSSPSSQQKEQMRAFLDNLKRAMRLAEGLLSEKEGLMGGLLGSQTPELIYLLESHPGEFANLILQVEQFGYRIHSFNSLEEFLNALEQSKPAAIIIDTSFPENSAKGIQTIAEIRADGPLHIPIIFISGNDVLQTRLQAAQAGGTAFFIKPVDIDNLIDKLDMLTAIPGMNWTIIIQNK